MELNFNCEVICHHEDSSGGYRIDKRNNKDQRDDLIITHNLTEKDLILKREILYKEVKKQQDEVKYGKEVEAGCMKTLKPRRIYKHSSKRVGFTKIRMEDCLRCDACSCIYIDERDYYKHIRNFHQKYNTVIPRMRRRSPENIRRNCEHFRSKITDSLNMKKSHNLPPLTLLNEKIIRQKIQDRWNKVLKRFRISQMKDKAESFDRSVDMSFLLSQVEVKIKTEPQD